MTSSNGEVPTSDPTETASHESLPAALTASDKSSFAYPTMKDRVPTILCKTIDILHRGRTERTEAEREEVKKVVESLAKLRYQLQTNKAFEKIADQGDDQTVWNDVLTKATKSGGGQAPKWFETTWLYAECYVYRRMRESFALSKLSGEDFFATQKKESLASAWQPSLDLLDVLSKVRSKSEKTKEDFLMLVRCSLWGNKCDMSISGGSAVKLGEKSVAKLVEKLQDKVIVDQSSLAWDRLKEAKDSKEEGVLVDIVMDNAGFELVADLVLAEFILESGLAKRVRLRVKRHPWFVSDTTETDIKWMLKQLEERALGPPQSKEGTPDSESSSSSSSPPPPSALDTGAAAAKRWRGLMEGGSKAKMEVVADPFWTYPHAYREMKAACPDLYRSLSEARLVIFKGDLNHRKLLSDLAWPAETSFQRSLAGFHPSHILTLRTLKADLVSGLPAGKAQELKEKDEKWMTNGQWAVMQYSGVISRI